jgi:hypothetical protein
MPKSTANTEQEEISTFPQVARLTWDMAAVNNRLGSIDERLEKLDARFEVFSGNFVTQREFMIVRNIVFGMVGLILIGFMGAVVALVWKGGG